MKRIFFATLAGMALFACNPSGQVAQQEETTESTAVATSGEIEFPGDSVSADGTMSFHGMRIDETGAVPVTELSEVMTQNGGAEGIKVAGTVTAACQNKGCWMTVRVADDKEMRVTFKDYGFFVPKDASDKTAIMEGNVYYDTTSVERLRHFAVDGGMSEAEAEKTITAPEISMAFEATGVIIKD
jgi:hypothetical protein